MAARRKPPRKRSRASLKAAATARATARRHARATARKHARATARRRARATARRHARATARAHARAKLAADRARRHLRRRMSTPAVTTTRTGSSSGSPRSLKAARPWKPRYLGYGGVRTSSVLGKINEWAPGRSGGG